MIFNKISFFGVPVMAQLLMNLTSIHEDASLIPGPPQQVKNPVLPWAVVQVGIGHRCVPDPLLLWLWSRPAATAPITPSLGTSICHGNSPKKTKNKQQQQKPQLFLKVLYNCLFLFFFVRATPMAYGVSQSRGWIRSVAASLPHSHSNLESELHLWPMPQLTVTLDP